MEIAEIKCTDQSSVRSETERALTLIFNIKPFDVQIQTKGVKLIYLENEAATGKSNT